MKSPVHPLFLAFASLTSLHAAPLAELTGSDATTTLTEYLTFSSDAGNVSASQGYWIDASQTASSTSSTNIQVAFTLTATGLADGESLDFSDISFDYTRVGTGEISDQIALFIDSGSGYQPFPLPDLTGGTVSMTAATPFLLENGDSVTFGFSFRDGFGAPFRYHSITDFHINGFFDLASDSPGIDLNNNGVSDIWEYRFGAVELVKDEIAKNQDFDGDGASNYEEALAGTNPFDANSEASLRFEQAPNDEFMICLPTEIGKGYSLYGGNSLTRRVLVHGR